MDSFHRHLLVEDDSNKHLLISRIYDMIPSQMENKKGIVAKRHKTEWKTDYSI